MLEAPSNGTARPRERLRIPPLQSAPRASHPGAGAPTPDPPAGGRTARVDFAFPRARLALEADSYRYHSSPRDWSRDRTRHNALIAAGWRVLPITYSDLVGNPAGVAEQIARCLDVCAADRFGTDLWKKSDT
ncbi:MAG: endonuclease domain-containing protein [Actinomycetota bacterium]